MALVNVYIKDPVVTRIKRDQKIPIIGFVANTGGLLGLCMGFSLISAFEIIFHFLISLKKMYLFLFISFSQGVDAIWKNKRHARRNRALPRSGISADVITSIYTDRRESNSVTNDTRIAANTIESSSLVVTQNQCRNSHNQQTLKVVKLKNSNCKSGLSADFVNTNHDGYIETTDNGSNTRKESSVTLHDTHLIESASNIDTLVNHTNAELPIKNIRSFLSLKPKRNQKCNKVKAKATLTKHNTSQKSVQTCSSNNKTYREVLLNTNCNRVADTSTYQGCDTDNPQKVNIILPPTAHSETSSVNSSKECLERMESITLQNENLSFHFDLDNFTHIDETDNETEFL